MRFKVRELPLAEADVRGIFKWLHERSPQGAAAWLTAYDNMVSQLEKSANTFGEAAENRDSEFDVRQILFKTRSGRVYRALFFIEGDEVFILRPRSFCPKTTDSRHCLGYSENLLRNAKSPMEVDRIWVCDITYIPLASSNFASRGAPGNSVAMKHAVAEACQCKNGDFRLEGVL